MVLKLLWVKKFQDLVSNYMKGEREELRFLREKCKEWGENEEFIFSDYELELPIRYLIQMSHRSGSQEKIWPRDTDLVPSMSLSDISWGKECRMRR